jgi:hypothetical protein
MADPPTYPNTNDDNGAGPDRDSTTSMPRWVKVLGVIALALALLVVILMLSGGSHGPGRHAPTGGLGGHPPPSIVMGHGGQQP